MSTERKLTKGEIKRLKGHIDYLLNNPISWENKDQYYEEYGYMVSILADTSFDSSKISRTQFKEILFAKQSKTREEFLVPEVQSYLPVAVLEIEDALEFVLEQEKELDRST